MRHWQGPWDQAGWVRGLLGAAVYIFMIGMGSFEVPAIIGLPQRIYVLSTDLYTSVNPDAGLPDYNTAAAYGAALLIAGLLLMYAYWKLVGASRRYAVVTGHGYKTAAMRLGKWEPVMKAVFWLYFVLALILPFLALLWIALSPYVRPVSAGAFRAPRHFF